jgi:putative transcriptional regulator
MSGSSSSPQPAAPVSGSDGGHGWPPAAVVTGVAAVVAIGLQLWGVYRVTGPPNPPWFPNADKLEHLVGFGLPVALIMVTAVLCGVRGPALRRVGIITGLVFVGHAVVSETIQHFFYTTRTGDPFDALADAAGVLLALLAVGLVTTRDPAPGDVLVASILLADGVFNQTVVLILDCDEDGALGVILNEISQTPLDAVLPDWVKAVSEPRLLFHGGPVSPNGAICLASVTNAGEEPPGWRPLFDTVGLLHLRIFAGYAGWGAGQLQSEIAEGMWHVADAVYDDVFGTRPLDLWRGVLRRQHSDLALFSTWVEDPESN